MTNISKTYNFPVELAPIKTNGVLIPNKVAVYRSDVKRPIGIVSNKYELLKHSTVINSFRTCLKSIETDEKIQLLKNGAHLFATYTMKKIKVEVRKNDIVSLQFVVKNSYDGSNSLQISLGAFRLVCSNGMVIGKQFFSYTQRHIGSKNQSIDTNILQENISQLTEQFKNTLPVFQKMNRQKTTSPVDKLFNKDILKIPTYLLTEAQKQYADTEHTVWDYYNSLTAAISHNLKKENPSMTIYCGKRVWDIAQQELN